MTVQPQTVRTTADIHQQLKGQSAQVLTVLGIDTDALKKHIRCPLGMHPDHDPSFRVDPARDRYFCSCTPRGGSLVDLVIQMGVAPNFRDAVVLLRSCLGLSNVAGSSFSAHRALNSSFPAVQRRAVSAPLKSNSPPQAAPADFDQVLQACTPPGRHPYLARKRIAPVEALLEPGTRRLVLRIHDASGQTVGLQFIAEDGSKRCAEGSKLTGNGLVLGDLKASNMIAVTEGWATGVTIHALLNIPVLVTFGAANMPAALERFIRSGQKAIIFADNDQAGHSAAIKARSLVGESRCEIILPKDEGLDFNDLYVKGSDFVRLRSTSGNHIEKCDGTAYRLVYA